MLTRLSQISLLGTVAFAQEAFKPYDDNGVRLESRVVDEVVELKIFQVGNPVPDCPAFFRQNVLPNPFRYTAPEGFVIVCTTTEEEGSSYAFLQIYGLPEI